MIPCTWIGSDYRGSVSKAIFTESLQCKSLSEYFFDSPFPTQGSRGAERDSCWQNESYFRAKQRCARRIAIKARGNREWFVRNVQLDWRNKRFYQSFRIWGWSLFFIWPETQNISRAHTKIQNSLPLPLMIFEWSKFFSHGENQSCQSHFIFLFGQIFTNGRRATKCFHTP